MSATTFPLEPGATVARPDLWSGAGRSITGRAMIKTRIGTGLAFVTCVARGLFIVTGAAAPRAEREVVVRPEEVRFKSSGITLVGLLYVPHAGGPVAGIMLIEGSAVRFPPVWFLPPLPCPPPEGG